MSDIQHLSIGSLPLKSVLHCCFPIRPGTSL